MRDAILLELARKWEHDARTPEVENGAPAAQIGNAIAKGERQAKRECADTLRTLVHLLGGEYPAEPKEKAIDRQDVALGHEGR